LLGLRYSAKRRSPLNPPPVLKLNRPPALKQVLTRNHSFWASGVEQLVAERRKDVRLIKAWDQGSIEAKTLLPFFREALIEATGIKADVDDALGYVQSRLRYRRKKARGPFSTPANFISWASARIREFLARREEKAKRSEAAAIVRPRPRSPVELAWFAAGWREAYRPSELQVTTRGVKLDLPLVDHEPPEITLAFDDLAKLASGMNEGEQKLLRLLALRIVGGWSLREIAKRDGSSLDAIAETWVEARSWLQKRVTPTVASIVTFDLIDIRLLEVLLSDPKLSYLLDWRTFERALAAIVERLGYEVELQRGTKDGGIDIIALKRDAAFGGHRYLLQAKRWSGRVGVDTVREILFLREHYRATKACLATTSTFTRGAWQLAEEYRWQLELRDYEKLMEWVDLLRSERR
jgi:hypothetical protein